MNNYFVISILLLILNINETKQEYKVAYFASGCFWCVESIYENLKGVSEVNSGYSGGKTINPTYREVMSGLTGHAEAIEVIYDPNVISYETLVNVFLALMIQLHLTDRDLTEELSIDQSHFIKTLMKRK